MRKYPAKTASNLSRLFVIVVAGSTLLLAQHGPKGPSPQKPARIYFNFFQHFDVPIGRDEALAGKRVAELYARYGIKADFYPTGSSLVNMVDHVPETVETLKRLGMPIGYHGWAMHDPVPSLAERIKDMSWDDAVQHVTYLESHRRPSPRAAEIDPAREGGIALIKSAFGEPPVVAFGSFGAGGLPPCAAVERAHQKMGVKMRPVGGSMLGYPLFWENGLLVGRTSPRTVMLMPNLVSAVTFPFGFRSPWDDAQPPAHPVAVLKSLLDVLPEDQITFVSFGWHPFQFVRDVQTRRLLSQDETETVFRIYEEVVRYVVTSKRVRVVTSKDVLNMVVPLPETQAVAVSTADEMAGLLLANWGGSPPEYLETGGTDFSLCDAFQTFFEFLREYSAAGRFPKAVTIRDLLGPTDTPVSLGIAGSRIGAGFTDIPATTVPVRTVVYTVRETAPRLTDRIPGAFQLSGRETAKGFEPSGELLDGVILNERSYSKAVLNPAEFLYCMAQAYRKLRSNDISGSVLVRGTNVFPTMEGLKSIEFEPLPAGDRSQLAKARLTRQDWYTLLQRWTVKPARLKTEHHPERH
ncbi:MAG: hypothetical protein HY238_08125 [Acidobacteria bacterium]|nr:hypothetical protein [Acidobacteriota bacterium]